MLLIIFRRLLGALPSLFILVAATFFLQRMVPGGPFDSDRAFPPEVMENIRSQYRLNQPLLVQFGDWIHDLARGDLHESFQYVGRSVQEILAASIVPSAVLGGTALVLAVLIGIPLGGFAAWKRRTWLDFSVVFASIAGLSLPAYLLASILVLIFSFWLGWLPPALWPSVSGDPKSLIMPIAVLAIRPAAMVARLVRTSMEEVLRADYIRTAHAKGLAPKQVVFKHALKNCLIPVVTLLGPLAANLVTGSFVVEVVFQIPGMGKHFVSAVINRDYPLVMSVTLVYGVILILTNLVVDLTYAWIDPRIRALK